LNAIEDLDEAIRLNRRFALAYMNCGATYLNLGEYQQVIADLDEALRLDPEDADAYYNRGVVYAIQGQLGRAIQQYDQSIRLNLQSDTYRSRGDAYLGLGNIRLAIRDRELGDYQRAIENYNEAIRLDSRDAGAHASRAIAYALLGKNELAEQSTALAVELAYDRALLERQIEEAIHRQ